MICVGWLQRVFVPLLQQHLPGDDDGFQRKFTNLVHQALVK